MLAVTVKDSPSCAFAFPFRAVSFEVSDVINVDTIAGFNNNLSSGFRWMNSICHFYLHC